MFSDDDLKHWKSIGAPEGWEKLPSLLARLEAAEVVCNIADHLTTNEAWLALDKAKETWKHIKAAGKASP